MIGIWYHWYFEYKVLLLTYKALNNLAAVYLSDLLQYRVDWGSRRDNTLLLVDSKINRVTFGGRAFFKAAPVLWNSITPSLGASTSVAQFRKNHKTYLCHKMYDCSCWRILIFNITNDLLVLQTNCFICLIYELILICLMSYIWTDFNFLYSALEYCRFGSLEILHYCIIIITLLYYSIPRKELAHTQKRFCKITVLLVVV